MVQELVPPLLSGMPVTVAVPVVAVVTVTSVLLQEGSVQVPEKVKVPPASHPRPTRSW
jgi:hypothetical protein